MTTSAKNIREFYRICYRSPEQPLLEVGRMKFVILDLSEAGVRFAIKRSDKFYVKDVVTGMIHFPNGRGNVQIRGVIIRVLENDVALRLDPGGRIPLAKIMDEQRHLIRKGML